MRRLVAFLSCAAVVVAPTLMVAALPADASSSPAGQLVKATPAAGTPDIKANPSGQQTSQVNAIAQVGNSMLLGGTFMQAANNASTTTLTRQHLLAFDQSTNQISSAFHPDPNGTIDAVIPSGDGSSVYVSGTFTSIGGVARRNVARVRVSDGAVLTDFNAGAVNGEVWDMRLSGGRLWLAGSFTTVKGTTQPALATVNPTTGAFDPFMRQTIAGTHNNGKTVVKKIDVTPDGSKLVGIGNFDTVGGAKRHQILMLSLSGSAATPSSWQTAFYEGACASSFNTYMRDLDISPDGSYFVVSTTGAYGGPDSPCDETARWEANATGSGLQPSWVDYTGGDTTYAVEITSSVVYTGGHARWQNNAFAGDAPGPGAVARPGIAALDPQSGLPFSWNPTRARGIGVFDFLVTSRGLWVGSDTTVIGGSGGRERIALLPAGGTSIPAVSTATLPNDIYLGGAGTVPANSLARRHYNSGTVGPTTSVPTGGIDWSRSSGAFMLNGQLYLASTDGSFTRRSFDGTSYGAPVAVDTQDELTPLTDWHNDIAGATGMFYDSKRIYFTKAGSTQLFYRYFNPESDVVGAKRLVASSGVSGIDFSQVRGMFGTGGQLFWAKADGSLNRINWQNGSQAGAPVAGTATQVSAPGNGWNARSLFLYQDRNGNPA